MRSSGVLRKKARRAEQSQPNRMIVAFVRGVLDIGENRSAIRATLIGKVHPVMRANLELSLGRSWPLHRSNVPTIGCQLVAGCQRKYRLEISGFAIPVDGVRKLNPVASIAGGETVRGWLASLGGPYR